MSTTRHIFTHSIAMILLYSVETGQMIQSDFPPKKAALVTAWTISTVTSY